MDLFGSQDLRHRSIVDTGDQGSVIQDKMLIANFPCICCTLVSKQPRTDNPGSIFCYEYTWSSS